MRKTRPESDRHHLAFDIWWTSGRKVGAVREKMGVPQTTVFRWMDSYAWHERADRLDNEARKTLEKKQIGAKARLLEEQAKAGELLRLQGLKMFDDENFNFRDERNAIIALVKGIEIERQAYGLSDAYEAKKSHEVDARMMVTNDGLIDAIRRFGVELPEIATSSDVPLLEGPPHDYLS